MRSNDLCLSRPNAPRTFQTFFPSNDDSTRRTKTAATNWVTIPDSLINTYKYTTTFVPITRSLKYATTGAEFCMIIASLVTTVIVYLSKIAREYSNDCRCKYHVYFLKEVTKRLCLSCLSRPKLFTKQLALFVSRVIWNLATFVARTGAQLCFPHEEYIYHKLPTFAFIN